MCLCVECLCVEGVCCGSNGSLCCPNNYGCDEKQLSCQLQDESSRLKRNVRDDSVFVQCGISDVACSTSQTCCRTNASSATPYACCDFPNVTRLSSFLDNRLNLFVVVV